MSQTTFDTLKDIFHVINPNVELDKLTPDTKISNELLDSISYAEFLVNVENHFDIRFPNYMYDTRMKLRAIANITDSEINAKQI